MELKFVILTSIGGGYRERKARGTIGQATQPASSQKTSWAKTLALVALTLGAN